MSATVLTLLVVVCHVLIGDWETFVGEDAWWVILALVDCAGDMLGTRLELS